MKVPGKFPLFILVGLAACTWVAVAVGVYGTKPDVGFFRPMGVVTVVLATGLAAYDRWLWRIPGFALAHGISNLNGTWIGELRKISPDNAGKSTRRPKPVAMVVHQTYTALSLRMFTSESGSVSVAAGLSLESDGGVFVTYVYRNDPRLAVQDKSRVHLGGARLALRGNGDVLEGAYWTDRDSKGEITLRRVSRKRALDLESAQKLGPLPTT